jgi:predicted ATP-grasp superfamily ATP-dependent carboligase
MVRSLGRLGVRVHCADRQVPTLAMRSRFCVQRIKLPDDPNLTEATVDALVGAACRIGGKPILLPTFDPRSLFVERHRSVLEEHYLLPQSPQGVLRDLYDKRSLHEICVREGIPTPATRFPQSRDEAMHLAQSMRFPLLVKAIDPDRLMRFTGGDRMALARSMSELSEQYARLDEPGTNNLCLQEYIPGTENDNWIVAGYFARGGERRFVMTGQKLRQLPVDGGITAAAVSRWCPPVVDLISRLAKAVAYHGPLDADVRYDSRDGTYNLLDVNPRPGANFRAFVDRNGMDVVRSMYLDLTGQASPGLEPVCGRRWIAESVDFWAVRELLRARALTTRDWLRSWREAHEFAHFDVGDPHPSLHFLGGFAGGVLKRAGRWLSKRPPWRSTSA